MLEKGFFPQGIPFPGFSHPGTDTYQFQEEEEELEHLTVGLTYQAIQRETTSWGETEA